MRKKWHANPASSLKTVLEGQIVCMYELCDLFDTSKIRCVNIPDSFSNVKRSNWYWFHSHQSQNGKQYNYILCIAVSWVHADILNRLQTVQSSFKNKTLWKILVFFVELLCRQWRYWDLYNTYPYEFNQSQKLSEVII